MLRSTKPIPNRLLTYAKLRLSEQKEWRPRLNNIDSRLFPGGGLAPCSLVEIFGKPKTGKTFLLQHLMVQCVLPKVYGGSECHIILINMRHKIDVQYFAKMIRQAITNANNQIEPEEMEKIVKKCLSNIQIVNCFSYTQLKLALHLVRILVFKNSNISLIAVDTLGEFFWPDFRRRKQRMFNHTMNWIRQLNEICKKYNVSCMYTMRTTFADPRPNAPSWAAPAVVVKRDYRLELDLLPRGRRTLNNRRIVIKNGLHFKEKKSANKEGTHIPLL